VRPAGLYARGAPDLYGHEKTIEMSHRALWALTAPTRSSNRGTARRTRKSPQRGNRATASVSANHAEDSLSSSKSRPLQPRGLLFGQGPRNAGLAVAEHRQKAFSRLWTCEVMPSQPPVRKPAATIAGVLQRCPQVQLPVSERLTALAMTAARTPWMDLGWGKPG